MSNLMLLVIIAAAVIVAGYVLSISRIDFSRHLLTTKSPAGQSDHIKNGS
jgi:hypothetical protein